jgi:hypothetical protein
MNSFERIKCCASPTQPSRMLLPYLMSDGLLHRPHFRLSAFDLIGFITRGISWDADHTTCSPFHYSFLISFLFLILCSEMIWWYMQPPARDILCMFIAISWFCQRYFRAKCVIFCALRMITSAPDVVAHVLITGFDWYTLVVFHWGLRWSRWGLGSLLAAWDGSTAYSHLKEQVTRCVIYSLILSLS